MYQITIDYALNGLIVQMGCQRIVFTDIPSFIVAINEYLTDPRGTEIKWRKERQLFNNLSRDMPDEIQPVLAAVAPPPPPNDYGLTATQAAILQGERRSN